LSEPYRSGDTRIAGIVGGVVFFVALAVTSMATDPWSAWTGYPTQVGDTLPIMTEVDGVWVSSPPLTEIEKACTLLLWIGPPITLSVIAMWLALRIRDRIARANNK
jgi:hypothetical protein